VVIAVRANEPATSPYTKLYNDQRNPQVFNLFIYLLIPFGLSLRPSSEAGVQLRQWFNPGYGVSARALTPYPGDLNHCQSCTSASEDGLKERPKHVRRK
jgi:hypothetical protein